MSGYLSKADRASMGSADFGEPSKKLWPVRDQSDLDRYSDQTLTPEVKLRLVAIARRKGLRAPSGWETSLFTEVSGPARELTQALLLESSNLALGDEVEELAKFSALLSSKPHGNPAGSKKDPEHEAYQAYQRLREKIANGGS